MQKIQGLIENVERVIVGKRAVQYSKIEPELCHKIFIRRSLRTLRSLAAPSSISLKFSGSQDEK